MKQEPCAIHAYSSKASQKTATVRQGAARRANRNSASPTTRDRSEQREPSCHATVYCTALATCEKTVFAFDPISRIVPTTITRMTATSRRTRDILTFFVVNESVENLVHSLFSSAVLTQNSVLSTSQHRIVLSGARYRAFPRFFSNK